MTLCGEESVELAPPSLPIPTAYAWLLWDSIFDGKPGERLGSYARTISSRYTTRFDEILVGRAFG
jgi:hypothetical protein